MGPLTDEIRQVDVVMARQRIRPYRTVLRGVLVLMPQRIGLSKYGATGLRRIPLRYGIFPVILFPSIGHLDVCPGSRYSEGNGFPELLFHPLLRQNSGPERARV